MGKAIQVLLFINLLLGAAVLYLGILVFQDRGVVKASTLLLEQNAATIAANLNWGGTVSWETGDERKLTTFSVPQPALPAELPALSSTLNELSSFATTRVAQLSQRYEALVQTRSKLADTEERLNARTRELATARSQIANLEATLASTQNDLREAKRSIETLRTEKAALEKQVEELNTEITDLNNRIAGQEVDLDQKIQERDKTITDYEKCRMGAAGGGRNAKIRGKSARILAINPEWNFVVIDKGTVDNIEPLTEALVHRGNQYVGRLTVMRVEGTVSVAEIDTATLTDGTTLAPGDTLFF